MYVFYVLSFQMVFSLMSRLGWSHQQNRTTPNAEKGVYNMLQHSDESNRDWDFTTFDTN